LPKWPVESVLNVGENKKDTVRTILEHYFEQFRTLNNRHRGELDSMMALLYSVPAPLLDDKGLRYLEEEREKM